MPRIVKIKGIGIAADDLLETVTNEQLARELAAKEPELSAYWFGNEWFRTTGYFSDGVAWLRETYEPKFEKQHSRRPEIQSERDWALLWELVKEEVQTSSEWIKKRMGVERRLRAKRHVATTDLMVSAGNRVLALTRTPKSRINGFYGASVSQDHNQVPTDMPLVIDAMEIPRRSPDGTLRHIAYSDAQAACCSFPVTLKDACAELWTGLCDEALVFGADVMSRTISRYSRSFGPVLGDHGAALLLAAEEGPVSEDSFSPAGFFSSADAGCSLVKPAAGGVPVRGEDLIKARAGGSRLPITPEMVACPFDQSHLMRMLGPKVSQTVGDVIQPGKDFSEGLDTLLVSAFARLKGTRALIPEGFSEYLREIDLIIFHQANWKIVKERQQELVERFGYRGQFWNNIDRFGNTTSAANLLCLYEAWVAGTLRKGLRVMIVDFGGGLTLATVIFTWTAEDYVTLAQVT